MLRFFYLLCPGPSGNHPLRTRLRCSNTSNMLQKEEKATTPKIVDSMIPSVSIDATQLY